MSNKPLSELSSGRSKYLSGATCLSAFLSLDAQVRTELIQDTDC